MTMTRLQIAMMNIFLPKTIFPTDDTGRGNGSLGSEGRESRNVRFSCHHPYANPNHP